MARILVCSLLWFARKTFLSDYLLTTDKKCPFTGDISIRGRILTGKVVSTKMNRTIIIRRDYLHYIPKYSRLSYCCFLAGLADREFRPLRKET